MQILHGNGFTVTRNVSTINNTGSTRSYMRKLSFHFFWREFNKFSRGTANEIHNAALMATNGRCLSK